MVVQLFEILTNIKHLFIFKQIMIFKNGFAVAIRTNGILWTLKLFPKLNTFNVNIIR